MTKTLAEKVVNRVWRIFNLKTKGPRQRAQILHEYLVDKLKHVSDPDFPKQNAVYHFEDKSAIIIFANYKHNNLGQCFKQLDYFNFYNDRKINQGFPTNSNKKDFVNGSLIEVMWDDSPPALSLIIEMDKHSNRFKGDFDIRVFNLVDKSINNISQTQIKRLIVEDISTILKESHKV